MYGLGKGLESVGNTLLQYPQLKMQAAELALKQKAYESREDQERFDQSMKMLEKAPEEGLSLSPDAANQLHPTVRGVFTKPETKPKTKPDFLESSPMPGTTAAAGTGVQRAPEEIPTGNFRTIPFEDVRQRAMAQRTNQLEAGKNLRLQLQLQQKQELAAQANLLRASWYQTQDQNEKARIMATLQGIYQNAQNIDKQIAAQTETAANKLAAQKEHWGELEQIGWANALKNPGGTGIDATTFADPSALANTIRSGQGKPAAPAKKPTTPPKSRFTIIEE